MSKEEHRIMEFDLAAKVDLDPPLNNWRGKMPSALYRYDRPPWPSEPSIWWASPISVNELQTMWGLVIIDLLSQRVPQSC